MKTALVIEDNEDNMVLITKLLQKFGYQTLQAQTGIKGYEMAIEMKPDFIILDIQLPDIGGIEVLKKIRASEEGKNIPVIAMTSYGMIGDRERLLAAGCNGYIEKPFKPRLVIPQIRKLIGEES